MEIRKKIKEALFDNTDLDLAHQEIGYLKDLCDAKDNVIAYQKELLNVQSESIKRYRLLEEELERFKEEIKDDREYNTRNKSTSRTRSRQTKKI